MSDFGLPAPRIPAKRGNVVWTLRMERMPDGSYVPIAQGRVEYLDEQDNPLPEITVRGNLLNRLTAQERNQIRSMMDRISALADGIVGLT